MIEIRSPEEIEKIRKKERPEKIEKIKEEKEKSKPKKARIEKKKPEQILEKQKEIDDFEADKEKQPEKATETEKAIDDEFLNQIEKFCKEKNIKILNAEMSETVQPDGTNTIDLDLNRSVDLHPPR